MSKDEFDPKDLCKNFIDAYAHVLSYATDALDEKNLELTKTAINKYFDRSSKMLDYISGKVIEGIENQKEGAKEMKRIYNNFVDFAYQLIFKNTNPYGKKESKNG